MKAKIERDDKGNMYTSLVCDYQLQVWKTDNDYVNDTIRAMLIQQSGLNVVEIDDSFFAAFDSQAQAERTIDFCPLYTTFEVKNVPVYVTSPYHSLLLTGQKSVAITPRPYKVLSKQSGTSWLYCVGRYDNSDNSYTPLTEWVSLANIDSMYASLDFYTKNA